MEVILTKDVESLGAKNEVVRVKEGYGRNYLLPRNLAVPASAGNLKSRSSKIKQAEGERSKRIAAAQEIAAKLSGKSFIILAKAGKEGKLFGSVTAQDVAGAIYHFNGIQVDKRKVSLTQPIKALGVYQVNIKLEQGVTAPVRVDIRPDVDSEAQEAPPAEAAPPSYTEAEHDAAPADAGEDQG